jgi:hypothetical protein
VDKPIPHELGAAIGPPAVPPRAFGIAGRTYI